MQKKFVLILVMLLTGSLLFGGTTGKIMGTVIDKETGEPIIGASIYLEEAGIGAASGLDGDFFIINVPPGTYNVVCSYIGYTKVTVTNVVINVDRTTQQNFTMVPKALQGEEVIVTGTKKIIEKDRTNSAAYVSQEKIENMPVQEVSDLIQLQTGIVKDASGAFHMRGGRAGEIAYMIDGVPVTDQYNGGSAIGMENSYIQELQVISGTFNAEYGQAQSGIVNIITKEGAKKFKGNINIATGDYITSHNDIFMGLDNVNFNESDFSINLQGPVSFLPSGSFYGSFRRYQNDGYLYGKRLVRTEDTGKVKQYVDSKSGELTEEETKYGVEIPDSLMTGDGEHVALDYNEKYSGYFKLATKLTGSDKLSYSLFWNSTESKNYSNARRFSPDGVGTYFGDNYNHILSLNHIFSSRTFAIINLSAYSKTTEFYLFEDPLNTLYKSSNNTYSDVGFTFGGTQNNRYEIKRSAVSLKGDLSSQVNKFNQVKLGFEYKQHAIDYYSATTVVTTDIEQDTIKQIYIPDQTSSKNDKYTVNPVEASAYLQDKIELNELIVNVGLRMDYWDPEAKVLTDLRAIGDMEQGGLRTVSGKKDAKKRVQVSPRFGLAYPISDKGVIHVSYGHFFQLPRFNAMYNNYEYEIADGGASSIGSTMGNPNLKPEKTVAYEIGLQQQLFADFSLNITMFYKDISNLLSQEIITTRDLKTYAHYINQDYGNVKGITVSLTKGSMNNISGNIDYTYQIARGNASDPDANKQAFMSGPAFVQKQIVPLDWDQKHTLNSSLIVGTNSGWNFGLIGRLATGQPYSPSNPGSQIETQFKNSERKPLNFNLDLNIYKYIRLNRMKVKLYCKVYNLTDQLNEKSVYSSSGTAEYPFRTNSQYELYANNPNFNIDQINLKPTYYTSPRRVVLGLTFDF